MKTNRLYLIAALLGTALVGCQKEEQLQTNEKPDAPKTWNLTVQVSMDQTKAMEVDGKKLKSYWVEGEKVNVFLGGSWLGTIEVESTSEEGAKATISGQILADGVSENSEAPSTLVLLSPGREDKEWTYIGQDGSAPSADGTLATMFNYEYATLKAYKNVEEKEITVTVAPSSFEPQQSVFRFGFKVGGAGDAIAVNSITLTSNKNKLVSSRNYGTNDWESTYGAISVNSTSAPDGNLYYMAVRNENDDKSVSDRFSFSVVRSSDSALLEGYKDIPGSVLGVEGKYLSGTVNVSQKTMAPAASATISSESQVL